MPRTFSPFSNAKGNAQGEQTGNVLTFTPPGFSHRLNVKFPSTRLPVCSSCKKNFKTKDMCRVRNRHTGPPWTTAYICLTLDDSCTDENGKYVDKPFVVRAVRYRPFCVIDDFSPTLNVPVCSTCKKTNRTRNFCRIRHKHRKLPWCTVYVMLSTQESADPSTIVAAPSTRCELCVDREIENSREIPNSTDRLRTVDSEAATTIPEGDAQPSSIGKPKPGLDDGRRGSSTSWVHDINVVPESRTMLIQINNEETTITWLKLLADDDNSGKGPQLEPASPDHNTIPTMPNVVQGAPASGYSYPPVAPATEGAAKRSVESTSQNVSQAVYRQHQVGGYHTPQGHPIPSYPVLRTSNEPPQHTYHYHQMGTPIHKDSIGPIQYGGHAWPYATGVIRPHSGAPPHSYPGSQHSHQRPISPAPPIGSPDGSRNNASKRSPAVTAGEAAAMRRKKARHEFEADDNPMSQPDLTPPHRPPVSMAPPEQSHLPIPSYTQVPLAPGPPPHQHHGLQNPHSQIHPDQQHHLQHQQAQSWMPMYSQIYHPSVPPAMSNLPPPQHFHPPFPAEAPRVTTFHTPESASRNYQHQDESPNNVTMTPGPGDGGGDHDSTEDDTDFNERNLLRE